MDLCPQLATLIYRLMDTFELDVVYYDLMIFLAISKHFASNQAKPAQRVYHHCNSCLQTKDPAHASLLARIILRLFEKEGNFISHLRSEQLIPKVACACLTF